MRAATVLLTVLGFARGAELSSEMLQAHNAVRSAVGVPPLQWSDELAGYALVWAERLVARDLFEHRPNNPYGENLYMVQGAVALPAQVVASWAAERANFDPVKNSCKAVCGHFTQIVWRETRRVGCASAGRGNKQVWVCNYDPPGNWRGKRPY